MSADPADAVSLEKQSDGVGMRTTTLEARQGYHKWTMDADEEKGIITYLRSLEPKSQGVVDFGGGHFPGGGGGKGDGHHQTDDTSNSGDAGSAK